MFKKSIFLNKKSKNRIIKNSSLSMNDIINDYNPNIEIIINDEFIKHPVNKNPIFVINLEGDTVRKNYINILMKKFEINYKNFIFTKMSIFLIFSFNFHLVTLNEQVGECASHNQNAKRI